MIIIVVCGSSNAHVLLALPAGKPLQTCVQQDMYSYPCVVLSADYTPLLLSRDVKLSPG
jgi:hypothetical protein